MPARLYDWDDILSRDRFTLRRGRDFYCSVSSMQQQVRNAASKLGLRVRIVEAVGGDLTCIVLSSERREVSCPE